MNDVIIIGIIIVAIITLLQILGRNMSMKKMTSLLEEENYDLFFKVSNGIICFLTVKPYVKENMKLSAYIAQEKTEEVKKEIELIENMRIQPQQKLISISNAFYYFLGKREGNLCKQMLTFVQTIGDKKLYNNLEIQYSVFILKESKYIQDIIKKLEITKKSEIPNKNLMMGSLEYLIGLQYSYLNDKENMMKYFKPALDHCKGTSYEVEIKNIMKEMDL